MSDFRSAKGQNPQWHQAGAGFSNFEFVDTRFRSTPILRRILSLARKLGFTSFLEEEILERDCVLLAEENAALALRLKDFKSSKITRISFFRSQTPGNGGEFLGYAVLKEDEHASGPFAHVYESVMRSPRDQGQNNFIHCKQAYTVRTSHGDFTVEGTLYAQQNDATCVCAHVALRTVLAASLPAKDISYSEINKLAGIAHDDPARCLGNRGGIKGNGLNPNQIEAILKQFGFQPEISVHEPQHNALLPTGVEFQRLLYGYLESGTPILLGFELTPSPGAQTGSRHIIPIVGHTFNEDLWAPEAERNYFGNDRGFFPSESWLSSYVAHDDNFGPYVCLPRHYLGNDEFRLLIGWHNPAVDLHADQAEALALDLVFFVAQQHQSTKLDWFGRMVAFARAGLLVLRAVLLSRTQYISHARSLRDRDGTSLEQSIAAKLEAHIPPSVWMVEISAPELFPASRRKFGEVLVATAAPTQTPPFNLLALRGPGSVIFVEQTTLRPEPTALQGHTSLYSH